MIVFKKAHSVVLALAMLLVVCIVFPTNCNAAQNVPDFQSLVNGWEEWFSRVTTIEPVCVIVEKEGVAERSFGANRSRYEYYQARGYFASVMDRDLTDIAISQGARPHVAGFSQLTVRPNQVSFARADSSSGYHISEVREELDEAWAASIKPPFLTAVLLDQHPSVFGLFSDTKPDIIQDDEGMVYIEKRTANLKPDSYGRIVNKVEVTFSKKQDWLPVKIVTEYTFATGEIGTWISEYQDWRDWEGLKIPFSQVTRLATTNEVISKSNIISVRRCKLSEVKERCRMEFYGIRSPIESKYFSWFTITILGLAGLAVVCGGFWLLNRAKQ